MMKKYFLIVALLGVAIAANASGVKDGSPRDKAIVQVFGNFHAGFGSENEYRGFELERSYLGYEYRLTEGLTVKGVVDIGKSNAVDDYHRIVYIKNAMLSWKRGDLTLSGGLIPTTLFNFQEKFWGYRYVMKSYQDLYKFGSSADLGISVAYRFTDWISADAVVLNGEGYKKIQVGSGLNYGLGITITPVKGLQMRLYGGLNEGGKSGMANIVNMAAFVGYKSDRFAVGAEYNHMLNSSYDRGVDRYGYSLFASVVAAKFANVYVRYDDQYASIGGADDREGQMAILGAEFKLGKYVKVAPNFRMSMPQHKTSHYRCYGYLNCSFGF